MVPFERGHCLGLGPALMHDSGLMYWHLRRVCEDLRALVVCNRDVEGDVLSARQILKALVRDPRTEQFGAHFGLRNCVLGG